AVSLLHWFPVRRAGVGDHAIPISRSTRVLEIIERRGRVSRRSINRNSSGLAIGTVAVDLHTGGWCCIAAVSIARREGYEWHREAGLAGRVEGYRGCGD